MDGGEILGYFKNGEFRGFGAEPPSAGVQGPCINARRARATAGREGGLSEPRARLVNQGPAKPPILADFSF